MVSGLIRLTLITQIQFTQATPNTIKLAKRIKSLAHYTKGTLIKHTQLRPLINFITFQPKKVFFQFSLTVLVHYRLFSNIEGFEGGTPVFK